LSCARTLCAAFFRVYTICGAPSVLRAAERRCIALACCSFRRSARSCGRLATANATPAAALRLANAKEAKKKKKSWPKHVLL
jgi:hypothetical protein